MTDEELNRLRAETFPVNTVVKAKGGFHHAMVLRHYRGIAGGVILSQPLEGFRAWNVTELEVVPTGTPPKQVAP